MCWNSLLSLTNPTWKFVRASCRGMTGFLPRDEEQARRATDLITRLLVEADVSHRYLSENTPSVE
jgi:hypothetical protein